MGSGHARQAYPDTHLAPATLLLRSSRFRPSLLVQLLALYLIITAILYLISAAAL